MKRTAHTISGRTPASGRATTHWTCCATSSPTSPATRDHRQGPRPCLYYTSSCERPCNGAITSGLPPVDRRPVRLLDGHTDPSHRLKAEMKPPRGNALRKGGYLATRSTPLTGWWRSKRSSPPTSAILTYWPLPAPMAKPACKYSSSATAN